jgi:hypothetical protein
MAMILEAGQVCPYADACPYNNNSVTSRSCYGAVSSRDTQFTCEFVVNGQIIKDAGIRFPEDKTGKMKLIVE